MPVVFTAENCKWSGALLAWMLKNISEEHQSDIHLVTADEEVSHVPCIVEGETRHVGLEQCTVHLRSLYTEPPREEAVDHVMQRDLSQYQCSVKSESNTEDRFAQLLAARG